MGLAYFLRSKIDGEFFAIIDSSNKPKKMFLEQTLVKFKKKWFFHDQIKKSIQTPDLEYLSNFEKKYNIDLWKLAINERHFYRFNRFYKFSKDEILYFLEQECKFFENVLEETNPEYLLTYDPPFHHQKLLLEMCKAKGIKVMCIYISRYQGKSIISDDGGSFNLPRDLEKIEISETKKVENQVTKKSGYNALTKKWTSDRRTTFQDKTKALKDYIFLSDSKNTEDNFTYYGRKKSKVIADSITLALKKYTRSRFINNNLQMDVNLNVPYVYFPLSIDEELTLLHYAPFFTDQIEVVRNVAKSLPIDYQLYVKEHIHAVFRGWRDTKDYKELMEIPNVTVIHPAYPSGELVKNSKLVITIRGTASLDAAYQNKPSIIFGDMSHDMIPSVYKVEDIKKIPELIKLAINSPVNPIYIKKYLELMKEKTVDFNWWDYEQKRNNQFYSGNILSDVEFPEDKVKEFFESNKEIFMPLVDAHLEKMA